MKKSLVFFSALVLGITIVFTGCKKDHTRLLPPPIENQKQNPKDYGQITGKVYSQNGKVALGAANVYIDMDGEVFFTKSKESGEFTLKAPAGDHNLMITTGDGSVYRTVIPVTVQKNKTTQVSGQNSTLRQVGQLAYIPGSYDNIETIVKDTLGYNISQISVSDLANLNTLNSYDAIFLNCGGNTALLDSAKYQNLRSYVAGGGSLYASDWAVEYLTGADNGNKVSGTHTIKGHDGTGYKGYCASVRQGGFIADSLLCTDKTGPSGMVYSSAVVDPSIQTVLGKNQIDIDYDLGAWEVINQVGPDWNVLIQDNNTYGPLAVRSTTNLISSNTGGSTSGNWVTICHIPPGNPNNPQTITISVNALQAHLAHGDKIGSCTNDGNILYTTFHNHHQGSVSGDVKKILQHFILNL